MEKTFHAYCWDAPASGEYGNLTTMVDSRDGGGTRMTPAEAKAALSLKEAGRRFYLDTYGTWNGETSDQLFTNAADEVTGEKTLWLANGISSVRTYNGDWWRDFRDLNGLVDFFSNDSEPEYGVWNSDYDETARTVWYADDRGYNSVNPGFNDLTSEMGFFDWHLTATLYGAGETGYWPGPNYLQFDYVTKRHLWSALRRAVTEPLVACYPRCRVGNWNDGVVEAPYQFYNSAGHVQRWPLSVGTHACMSLYGTLQSAVASLDLVPGTAYGTLTPYKALLVDVNKVKGCYNSAPHLPITAWLPYRQYNAGGIYTSCYTNSAATWKEAVYHAALNGLDYFMFWNPIEGAHSCTAADCQLMEDAIDDLHMQDLHPGGRVIYPYMVAYDATYIASGMVNRYGVEVFRITRSGTGPETITLPYPYDDVSVTFADSTAGAWVRRRASTGIGGTWSV